jgi:adenosylmethionine-8-amino-7-oxononanoate aminotransferase
VRPLRLASCDLVYLMPPLVIGDDDLDVLCGAVVEAVVSR